MTTTTVTTVTASLAAGGVVTLSTRDWGPALREDSRLRESCLRPALHRIGSLSSAPVCVCVCVCVVCVWVGGCGCVCVFTPPISCLITC